MTEVQAKKVISESPAWSGKPDYALETVQETGNNDTLYFFTASYKHRTTGKRSSVPLGIHKMTGAIVNCTVDED